jgi:glutathione-regulated potassium-efflux system ancillary protein KefG
MVLLFSGRGITMNKILIIFAHPRFEKSKTNRALLDNVTGLPDVTLNDLYEQYPDFNIDVNREQELLLTSQVIVWHHPLYMYGAPALLKQWIDLVLEHGWAHGREGDFLKNKIVFNTITAGGTREVYAAGQYNRFTIRELLAPFEQTANLCKMIYLPPFTVHGTYLLTGPELAYKAGLYRTLLLSLSGGDFDLGSINQFQYLNDWLLQKEK